VDTEGYGPYQGIRIDASGVAFEVFVTEILSRDPEIELVSASLLGGARENAGYGTSFVAVRRGRVLLIEARAVTPQTSRRLEEQGRQLRDATRVYMERHPRELEPVLVLACPGVLRQPSRAAAVQESLEIWDGPYLRAMAGQLDVTVAPGVAWGDEDSRPPGYGLASRLAGIRRGTADWPAYEKYCQDLLSFLFVPPLNPPIPQSRDERHVNRRDYVLPNYAADYGFWHSMRTHYEAHLVVAEVLPVTQDDDVAVIGDGDARAEDGPAGRVLAGPWCAWWRGGGQSVVTSVMAARALCSSTIGLRSAQAATGAWVARLLTARGRPRAASWIKVSASSLNSGSERPASLRWWVMYPPACSAVRAGMA
jgi:hypothetical protein